jgi:hypothetical protein
MPPQQGQRGRTLTTVPQRKFIRGLNATSPIWSQAPGTVPRISNFLYTKRGGLDVFDGSAIVANNADTHTFAGPITELALFLPIGVNQYYILTQKDTTIQVAAPTGLAIADGGAGGTLAAGTYFYVVTALDGAGGETTASNEVTITILVNHKVNLNWNASVNAAGGYRVYRTVVGGGAGNESLIVGNGVPQGTVGTPFVDNLSDANALFAGVTVPTTNNTQCHTFYKITNRSPSGFLPRYQWDDTTELAVFPADELVSVDQTPGGFGGGGSPPGGATGPTVTPFGGVLGNTSPIPQFVPYTNKMILCLGNGFPPQVFTDPSTIAQITNTFTATFPAWQATTVYTQGDQIASGGNLFTAIQGGTSGGGAPAFPATLGQTVTDNQIIWKNVGNVSSTPAPRGAAHGIVYAGSLWLGNTQPTTTSDNFDGPSCIKMSDINNPNSWNPLNTAFVGKDDGDQITGLATFTIAETGIAPTGSLVVFKSFSTYQVTGVFGATDFSIQQAQTDMGCIASRSIQFLPGFGIVRLTHLGIALFDGVRDRLISEEIRPYLFGGEPDIVPLDWNYAWFSKGAQCAIPPMYMLAIPIQSGGGTLAALGGIGASTL